MKFFYYSILYSFYKISKLGRSGDLWSAGSTSIFLSFVFTISLHFTLGEILGREAMVRYHSILWGNIILVSMIFTNFYLFVWRKKYLLIEKEFSNNKSAIRKAIAFSILFSLWVLISFIIAFSNNSI
jgi:hypothetical protein